MTARSERWARRGLLNDKVRRKAIGKAIERRAGTIGSLAIYRPPDENARA
jgi:hypothetical protein